MMRKVIFPVVCLAFLGAAAMAQTGAAPIGQPMGRAVGAASSASMPHNFKFEIDGVIVAGVHTISDLDALQAQASAERARPGNNKPGKITVTKDWSNTSEWSTWYKTSAGGKTARKSISLIFHNDAGEEAGRMNFYNCWPSKFTPSAMNARNSAHATESLEINYERMEWVAK